MPTCRPGKVDAKADVAPSGGQLSGKSSALRSGGFCVFWINFDCRARQVPLGYDQSHASLRYIIAKTRTANAGSQSRQADGSPLVRWHWCLCSPGRSACHSGNWTGGICIQLAAPDAQSNAAKEEKFYDRVHPEQAEASLRPQTTDSTR